MEAWPARSLLDTSFPVGSNWPHGSRCVSSCPPAKSARCSKRPPSEMTPRQEQLGHANQSHLCPRQRAGLLKSKGRRRGGGLLPGQGALATKQGAKAPVESAEASFFEEGARNPKRAPLPGGSGIPPPLLQRRALTRPQSKAAQYLASLRISPPPTWLLEI